MPARRRCSWKGSSSLLATGVKASPGRSCSEVLTDADAGGCNKVQLLSHKRHASDGAHRLYATIGFEAEAEGFRLYLQGAPGSQFVSERDAEVDAT